MYLEFWKVKFFSRIVELSYTHTERQALRYASPAAARSHWNVLWRSKMSPRSIPKRHGKRQNFKAAAWRLTYPVGWISIFVTWKLKKKLS